MYIGDLNAKSQKKHTTSELLLSSKGCELEAVDLDQGGASELGSDSSTEILSKSGTIQLFPSLEIESSDVCLDPALSLSASVIWLCMALSTVGAGRQSISEPKKTLRVPGITYYFDAVANKCKDFHNHNTETCLVKTY